MRHFRLLSGKKRQVDSHWKKVKLSQTVVSFLALTSIRSNIFSLGSTINDLSSLEGGVVAVWCWLPAWGLSKRRPWGSNQPIDEWACWDGVIPPQLSQNPAGVCRDLINHSKQAKHSNMPFLPQIPAKFVFLFVLSPAKKSTRWGAEKTSYSLRRSKLLSVVLISWV